MSSYSLSAYGRMADDPVRMSAYVEAMRRSIRPGDVVVDIGTGPGVMALLACQMGASRVYAIETHYSIEIARLAAHRNGFQDKIVFFQRLSTELELPERADVLVSDLRGQLPLLREHIPSIVDARQRLLKPGGVQLPMRDRLFVGLCCDESSYRNIRRPWLENNFGLDLSDGFRPVVNSIHRNASSSNRSIGLGHVWAELDYTSIESPSVRGSARIRIPDGELINGLELWFEAEVCEGIKYNTGPGQPEQVYGRSWLPLEVPITAGVGDELVVDLSMTLVDGDYVIGWDTTLCRGNGEGLASTLRQSSFYGTKITPTQRALMNPKYQPACTERGEAMVWLLGRFGGSETLLDLATALYQRYANIFLNLEQAITFVRAAVSDFGMDLKE